MKIRSNPYSHRNAKTLDNSQHSHMKGYNDHARALFALISKLSNNEHTFQSLDMFNALVYLPSLSFDLQQLSRVYVNI
jgi:hypothetical protein